MLSSKVVGSVTRQKSKSLLLLQKYSPTVLTNLMLIASEKHISQVYVNALENNYNVTSNRQVYPHTIDTNCTNAGKLGSSKTQM